MKINQNYKCFVISILLFVSSCSPTEECTNNLTDYPFPYSNGQILTYENENDSIRNFEVIITFEDLGVADMGDEGHYDCAGYRSMEIHDFRYEVRQEANWYLNDVSESFSFKGYWKGFERTDTIVDYEYRNEKIIAYTYQKVMDSLDINTKYFKCTISDDRKLLDFSKRENDVVENWYLQ